MTTGSSPRAARNLDGVGASFAGGLRGVLGVMLNLDVDGELGVWLLVKILAQKEA